MKKSSEIIAFFNNKGGVGKTTTAINVAAAFRRSGKRVLLVDLDGQANATMASGVILPEDCRTIYDSFGDGKAPSIFQGTSGIHVIPSDRRMYYIDQELANKENRGYILASILSTLRNHYDYIVLDCPPAFGTASVNGLYAADWVILVSNMSGMTTMSTGDIMDMINMSFSSSGKKKIIGYVWTMNRHTSENKQVAELVKQQYGPLPFDTTIRMTTYISEAAAVRKDIFEYNKDCEGAKDYYNLSLEIEHRINTITGNGK